MVRLPMSGDRCAMALAAALCVAAATPLRAQQVAGAASPTGASAAPASPAAALPGPRLRPKWRRVEPTFADSSVTAPLAASAAAASHTVTFSTLTLVLVIIIVVLLIT